MKRSIMLVVVAVLLFGIAQADTLSVRLNQIAAISGTIKGQERARVVLSFPLPERVLGSRIDFVKLEFPAVLRTDTNYRYTIEGYRITTRWEERRVTWNSPWRRPGGDFDSSRICWFTTATSDSHPVVLDITNAVKDWQANGNNFGLLLKRPEYEGGGFWTEIEGLRGALNSARVKFYFVPIQE